MVDWDSMERYVLELYAVFGSSGKFSGPDIDKSSWVTVITYLGDHYGVSIEINSRDSYAGSTIVETEGRILPPWGERRRKALNTIIQEQGWLDIAMQPAPGLVGGVKGGANTLKEFLALEKKGIVEAMPRLDALGKNIFR